MSVSACDEYSTSGTVVTRLKICLALASACVDMYRKGKLSGHNIEVDIC